MSGTFHYPGGGGQPLERQLTALGQWRPGGAGDGRAGRQRGRRRRGWARPDLPVTAARLRVPPRPAPLRAASRPGRGARTTRGPIAPGGPSAERNVRAPRCWSALLASGGMSAVEDAAVVGDRRGAHRPDLRHPPLPPAGVRGAERERHPRLDRGRPAGSGRPHRRHHRRRPRRRGRGRLRPTAPAVRRPPMVAIPGNHDVGGFSGDRFDARRLDASRNGGVRTPGPGTSEPWRLVGGDVYRLGEDAHDGWLATHCAPSGRPCSSSTSRSASFIRTSPTPATGRCPWRRGALLVCPLVRNGPVRVVASGHLHRYRAGDAPRRRPDPVGASRLLPRDRTGRREHLPGRSGRAPAGPGWDGHPPDGRAARSHHLRLEDFAPSGSESLRDAPLLPLERLGRVRAVRRGA